jgi:hypothetical protein
MGLLMGLLLAATLAGPGTEVADAAAGPAGSTMVVVHHGRDAGAKSRQGMGCVELVIE